MDRQVIQTENVSKVYRVIEKSPGLAGSVKALFRPNYQNKTAVDHVSFTIDQGEMVGYIGVNGAGKSTTIKMLTGILVPTSGRVTVLGRDPHRERVANARAVGVVFGQRSQLWWDLPLIESMQMIGRIYDVPTPLFKQRLEQFTHTLDMAEMLKTPVRSLSLGQKMRAELAATLIHDPRVVYLDEPTIGLDLIVKERIRAFIKEQNQSAQTTVMLTTHDLGDIEELCKRVMIIDAGKLIYDGPLSMIRDRFGKHRRLTFESIDSVSGLHMPTGAELESDTDHRIVVRFDRTITTASQVAASVMNQINVTDFSIAEPDLTSIIKQIYNGALAGDTVGQKAQNAQPEAMVVL